MSRGVGSERKFFSRFGLILSICSLTTVDLWASLARAVHIEKEERLLFYSLRHRRNLTLVKSVC